MLFCDQRQKLLFNFDLNMLYFTLNMPFIHFNTITYVQYIHSITKKKINV